MQTSAGREREALTGRIREANERVALTLLAGIVGAKTVMNEQERLSINGGGELSVRDLCSLLSVEQLKKAAKRLGV